MQTHSGREQDGKVVPVTDAEPSGLALAKNWPNFNQLIRGQCHGAEKAVAISWLEHLIKATFTSRCTRRHA